MILPEFVKTVWKCLSQISMGGVNMWPIPTQNINIRQLATEFWGVQWAWPGSNPHMFCWWLRRPSIVMDSMLQRSVMGIILVLWLNSILQLLYFAKCNLHLYCVFFCITLLNQKYHVTSTIFREVNLILKISLHTWSI